MKKVILTGDRPTGHLHVGHYVGSLQERVASGKSTTECHAGCIRLFSLRD